jgi:nucleobase:cation symporter-1, NCS1 family
MVPWTAINLIDYYLLRQGEYNVWDVFDSNGQYGKFNWTAISAYLISVIFEIPFVNSTMYVGPISKALDGTDIAWIAGLIVPLILYYYYYPMKKRVKVTLPTQEIEGKTELVKNNKINLGGFAE